MAEYTSQEDAIYARATERGISHDLIYDYFDKVVDQVTEKFHGKSSNWRFERAEKCVWVNFCES
jgi:hypothetical protein